MTVEKLNKMTLVCTGLSVLFSLTLLSFHADVSLVGFPLMLLFTVFLYISSVRRLFGGKNLNYISVFRILLQYEPYVMLIAFVFRRAGEYGTSYALDLVSVLLWCAVTVMVLIILHYLNPKVLKKYNPEWNQFIVDKKYKEKKERSKAKAVVQETLSWVDALVQAVFMVLLLNVFIVQLYEIPSESMVPEFLKQDRVVVFKTLNGPKFPLSDVGLPCIRDYRRGDIVVFRNPHYKDDRKSNVRTFVSQIVYMCTLTKKNINVDEYGRPKSDPLVKRVCGVPGEQLMMQDGILYSRTKDSDEFKPVEADSKWAAWNLNDFSAKYGNKIEDYPLTNELYDSMIETENLRNYLDLDQVESECLLLADEFDSLYAASAGAKISSTDFSP